MNRQFVIEHETVDLILHKEYLYELPKGSILVCSSHCLDVYYLPSRYYNMAIVDRAYHACLIAQSIGVHARDLQYPDKPKRAKKSKPKIDVDGNKQLMFACPDCGKTPCYCDIPF